MSRLHERNNTKIVKIMQFVPFLYFTVLSCYLWYRNKNIDIATYMSILYTITSFCAAIIVTDGHLEGSGILFDGWEPELNVVPTFLYCGLITLTILPFTLIKVDRLTNIIDSHPILTRCFVVMIAAEALLNLYIVADSTVSILSGDLKEVRDMLYNDEMSPADIKLEGMPTIFKFFDYTLHVTFLALPLFFYYSCIKKYSLWFTAPLLLISVSPIIRALQTADRTELVNYGIMFGYCLVFCKNIITKKIKWFISLIGLPIVAIASIYLVAVTAARFDDTDEGSSGSVLQYAGQPYLNFCYFYENHNESLIYMQREFPILSHVCFKQEYSDVKAERTAKEGFFIGVFATHIGSWILDVGKMGAILISVGFSILVTLVIYRYDRTSFDLGDALFLFVLANIPLFGIFYYRFHSFTIALQYLFAGLMFLIYKLRFIFSTKNQQ